MLSAGQHLQHIGLENNHAMLINNPSGNLIPDGHKDDIIMARYTIAMDYA